jgi:hypothetical protein
MSVSVHEWSAPPQMDVGAPLPSIRVDADRLWVAYLRRDPEATGVVLRFDGVSEYHFGGPNDERLHEHPLYSAGLSFYAFYEARGSERLRGRKKKHWIATFHDETLEVIADSATIVEDAIEGENTRAMLEKTG